MALSVAIKLPATTYKPQPRKKTKMTTRNDMPHTPYFRSYPSPCFIAGMFTEYEIATVREFIDSEGRPYMERVTEQQQCRDGLQEALGPVLYGVYGRRSDNLLEHLFDRRTKAEAEETLKFMGVTILSQLYYVIPIANDGNMLATTPEPMPLASISSYISTWLMRFEHQGYFLNCWQERIPIELVSLLVVTQDAYENGSFCR